MQNQYVLHHLALDASNTQVRLTLVEAFAVAAGVTTSGTLVLPVADASYLVAGGVEGMPWLRGLGAPSKSVLFKFPIEVGAIVLATESNLRPVVEVLPAPTISVTQLVGQMNFNNGTATSYHYTVGWSGPSLGDILPTDMWCSSYDGSVVGAPIALTLARAYELGWTGYDPFAF